MKTKVLLGFIFLFSLPSYSLFACTAFYAANDKIALAGKNEDAISADHYIWFCPPEDGKYGRIYFGSIFFLDHKEAGNGLNDQGLFFNIVFAPDVEIKNNITGESYLGNLLEKILEECSSIEEALILIEKYNNLQYYANFLIMLGDRHGHSLIIELGKVIEHNSPFLILPPKDDIPCDQYLITHSTLQNNKELSINLFKKILANVHVEGTMGLATTVYSTIYDLRNGKIYLYYFHNFMEEVIIDINEELKEGTRTIKIESLFPKNISAEDYVDLKNKELKQRIESRLATNISLTEYVKILGEYKSLDPASNDRFNIILENEKLYITENSQSKFELFPESSNKYFLPSVNGDFSLTFYKDESDNKLKVLAEHELYAIQQTFQRIN
jgi:hypothetical protein